MAVVTLSQTCFRFGYDDGTTQANHTFRAAENANAPLPLDTTIIIRIGIQESGGAAASNLAQQFQCAKNGGSFQNITTSSTIAKAVTPSSFANNADSTTRLTTLTGSADSSNVNCTTDGSSGGSQNDVPASGHSETVLAFQLLSANLAEGDYVDFRCTVSGPTTSITYTVTPRAFVPVTRTPPVGSLLTGSDAPAQDKGILLTVASLAFSSEAPSFYVNPPVEDTPLTVPAGEMYFGLEAVTSPSIQPPAASLTFASEAPLLPVAITPPVASLTATGVAPVLNTTLFPQVASLAFASESPQQDRTLTPPVASLTLTGVVPVQSNGITPLVASLLTTGAAPSLNFSITPPVASLLTGSDAPTKGFGLFPSTSALTLAGTIPSQGVTVTPPSADLSMGCAAPLPVRNTVLQENIRLSLASGGAFVDFGVAGLLTPYLNARLTLVDGNGKTLVGYIKAAGSGETYGSELLPNAGFADTSDISVADVTVQSLAGGQSGNYLQVDADPGVTGLAYETAAVVNGGHYLGTAYHKNISGVGFFRALQGDSPFTILWHQSDLSDADWALHTLHVASVSESLSLGFGVGTAGGSAGWDTASLKRVLTPAVTGVTIVSSPGSEDYTWATEESGFNRDDSEYTYYIEISNFITPPTAALTFASDAPSAGGNPQITPDTASLGLTGYAPSISKSISPPAASLTLTGIAPIPFKAVFITPDAASLLTGSTAPSLFKASFITPPAASLTLTGIIPSSLVPIRITPPVASLIADTYAPTSLAQGATAITIPTAKLIFGLKIGTTITPPVASLTLTPVAPLVAVPVSRTPLVASLAFTAYAPRMGQVIRPPAGEVVFGVLGAVANQDVRAQSGALSLETSPTLYWTWSQTAGDPVTDWRFEYGRVSGIYTQYSILTDETLRSIPSRTVITAGPGPWYLSIVAVSNGVLGTRSNEVLVDTGIVELRITRLVQIPTASLALTAAAPTISAQSNFSYTPPVAALALTGVAPSLIRGQVRVPPVAALTMDGIIPGLAATSPIIEVPVASLTLTPAAPTPAQGSSIIPPVGSLTTASEAPTVQETIFITRLITPPSAQLALTPGTPTPFKAVFITPPTASLLTQSAAVSLLKTVSFQPPTGALITTGVAPAVSTLATLPTVVGTLALGSDAPSVFKAVFITPPSGSLLTASAAPVKIAASSITIPTAALTTTAFAPNTVVPGNTNIYVPTASLTFTSAVPVVYFPIMPSVAALAFASEAPVLVRGTVITPTATTVRFISEIPTPQRNDYIEVPWTLLRFSSYESTTPQSTVITPPTGELTTASDAPSLGRGFYLIIPSADLTVGGEAPSQLTPKQITVPAAEMVLEGTQSDVNVPPNEQKVILPTGLGMISSTPVTVRTDFFLTIPTGVLSVGADSPSTASAVRVVPPPGSLVLVGVLSDIESTQPPPPPVIPPTPVPTPPSICNTPYTMRRVRREGWVTQQFTKTKSGDRETTTKREATDD